MGQEQEAEMYSEQRDIKHTFKSSSHPLVLMKGNGFITAAIVAMTLIGSALPQVSIAGDIAGAIVGGAIGSQVGQGRGKIAATAAGAYIGSKTGERLSDPDAPGINAGNMAGAIVGGAVGSQVGGGNGRLAATAAGAVIGSNMADRADENARRQNTRQPRAPVNTYADQPAYAPQQRYYRPSVQYQSSEPGGPVVIQGGGY